MLNAQMDEHQNELIRLFSKQKHFRKTLRQHGQAHSLRVYKSERHYTIYSNLYKEVYIECLIVRKPYLTQ